jgi:aminopeptidase C
MDQGATGECVLHAAAAACAPALGFVFSQQTAYRLALELDRAAAGMLDLPLRDEGCQPSSAVHALQTYGCVPRATSPDFDVRNSDSDPATIAVETDLATLLATRHELLLGQFEVYSAHDMMTALAVLGKPIIVSYCSIGLDNWTPADGAVGAPKGVPDHCSVCYGYLMQPDGSILWLVQNSWGTAWGDHGCFTATNAWQAGCEALYVFDVRVVSQ